MSVRERIDIKSTGGDSEFSGLRRADKGNRQYALEIHCDNLFTSAGSSTPQNRGLRVEGERVAANVMGGDAHDWVATFDYTNRAVNTPAGSYCRGISVAVQNRDSGALSSMQGALFSTRQRGDGAAVPEQRVLRADLTHDVGGTVSTGLQECFRANIKIHANGAAHADTAGAAAIVANNDATGSYSNKPNAFAIRSLGQPFQYLFDCYDSRVNLAGTAIMRFPVADGSSLPAFWFIGTQTDDNGIRGEVGADNTIADGSWYSSISDGAGDLFIKKSDTWTAGAN